MLEANPGWWQRVDILTHDLSVPFSKQMISTIRAAGTRFIDYIVAMASESHVDRSIEDPVPFVRNNVDVILNTLELARKLRPRTVLVICTDEVYGPCEPLHSRPEVHGHQEWAPIIPSNPYAASKAAQEAIAIAYWRTYGTPVMLTNTMNVVGQRQDPEKYLPMLIKRRSGQPVTVHGTPDNIGTRHYLHARNAASAWLYLLEHTTMRGFPQTAALAGGISLVPSPSTTWIWRSGSQRLSAVRWSTSWLASTLAGPATTHTTVWMEPS